MLLGALAACARKEADWGPPPLPTPQWAVHVLGTPLASGHTYLRFDIPVPHTDTETEALYEEWLAKRGWSLETSARKSDSHGWSDYTTKDGTEGRERAILWVDRSRKWTCRLSFRTENAGALSAHLVVQPSLEVPIEQ